MGDLLQRGYSTHPGHGYIQNDQVDLVSSQEPESLLTAVGLLTALAAGMAAALQNRPFLTGLWWPAGGSGETHVLIGTPLIFDIGVFLTVLGTILTLVLALEEED